MELSDIAKRLVKEIFQGKEPGWEPFDMKGIPVLYAKDKNKTYILKDYVVYVQQHGTGNMTCYNCGSNIETVMQTVSLWSKEYIIPGGSGKTKTKEIPYCPKCEKKPEGHDIEFSDNA